MKAKCISVDIAKAIMAKCKDFIDRKPGDVKKPAILLSREGTDVNGNLSVFVSVTVMFNPRYEYNNISCLVTVKDDYANVDYEVGSEDKAPSQQ